MKRTSTILLLVVAGCGGTTTTPPETLTPSISAVEPASVFLGRTAEVRVAGFATKWSDSTTVAFGDGVTVNKVVAASETGLIVNVTIAPTAALGMRDLTVMDAGTNETYKEALNLASPVRFTVQGTQAQGTVLLVHVDNRDNDNPFDTTSMGDGLFVPLTYPNFNLTSPTGTTLTVSAVDRFGADMTMLVDVTAPAAAVDFDVLSGPKGMETHFPAPGAINLAARMPTALSTSGVSGMVDKPYDSLLYSWTPTEGVQIHDVAISTNDPNGTPQLALLPKSGAFADLIAFSSSATLVSGAADTFYAIVWDNTGTAGYSFSITRKETMATGLAEMEPNESQAMAQSVAAAPGVIQNGTLTADTDQDWFKLAVTGAEVGKVVHVQTVGDGLTDTLVDVLDQAGTSLGGPSDDLGYQEDFTSTPIITGTTTIFVQVSASQQGFFDPMHNTYSAIVRFE